jgi:integrase/recombinase XerD
MNPLQDALDDYLSTRRSVGFKLRETEHMLRDYVAYLDRRDATTTTTDLALTWAKQPINVAPHRWHQRLTAVRGFAKYLHALDAAAEVPPANLLVAQRARTAPYIYSELDVAALLAGAATLAPPFRADTYRTLLGLLAVTGMRVGEAIRLDCQDVNWTDGLLTIRASKFNRSREVVLHPTTVDALRSYQRLCRSLVRGAGLEKKTSSQRRPRLHDLRHTFAVNTIINWYRDGLDAGDRLYLLSTYLGHIDPKGTYWYLSGIPELLELAGARLEQMLGDIP